MIADQNEYALFLEYECDISTVKLQGIGTISRAELANIVMICDALICIWFVIYTAKISIYVDLEKRDMQKEFV